MRVWVRAEVRTYIHRLPSCLNLTPTLVLTGDVTCDMSVEARENGACRWPVLGGEVTSDPLEKFDPLDLLEKGAVAVGQGERAVCMSVGEVMAVPSLKDWLTDWLEGWLEGWPLSVVLAKADSRPFSDSAVSAIVVISSSSSPSSRPSPPPCSSSSSPAADEGTP